MTVNFTEIGWSSWIVGPLVYDAGNCVGQCDFPMLPEDNPTNHAVVLSSMTSISNYPVDMRMPCCSPSSYKSLNILHYDADDFVVLKTFDKMIALNCGCR